MELGFFTAFVAGLVSFLSPCVLPLVPTYMLYLGSDKGKPVVNSLFFIAGFSLVFFLISTPFLLGRVIFQNKVLLGQVGGALMIVFGLYVLGLGQRLGFNIRYSGETRTPWGAFVLGMVLAIGWTPCIGAILGGILTLSLAGQGVGLLVAYLIGLGVPFFLVALFADRVQPFLRKMAKFSHWTEVVAGTVMVAVGVLLVSGTFTRLNALLNNWTPDWLRGWL